MCLKSIILNILTVKNLIFNLHAFGFSLSEYKNFYSTDGAQVIESLEKIDDKYWSMESNAEHSLFNFYQKSIFYVENDQIYLVEMQRNLRAFGGLRKEKQKYKIDQETKEVEYVFNKKTGKFNFDEFLHGNLTLQLQLKFDLDSNKIPLINQYYFLDKGKIRFSMILDLELRFGSLTNLSLWKSNSFLALIFASAIFVTNFTSLI